MATFTALSFDSYKDTPYELHKAGCKDITKKRAEKWNVEADSIDEAVDQVIDGYLRDMGYNENHCRVFPCCNNHS